MRLEAWFVLVTLSLVLNIPFNGLIFGLPRQKTEEAYVTLLYGNDFLLGARVLGKSIQDTGSTKDMVALVTDGVSDYAMKLLEADGWIVTKVGLVENPNYEVRPRRLWGVYTKLRIFNMTNYKKVVYLDADTIVVRNIENMFKCGKFCAILKHSERFNAGVLVVEPSRKVFDDMISKVKTLESYTGGDQGFLDAYFSGFINARVFDPNLPQEVVNSKPVPEMERLPTIFNADVGQYMISNKWKVNESEISVLHYTIGPLKPWDWWAAWLLKPVDIWQNIRLQLPESLNGTGGGSTPYENVLIKILVLLPFCAFFFCYYRSLLQTRECFSTVYDHIRHIYFKIRYAGPHAYAGVSTSSTGNPNHQAKVPFYIGGVSVIFSFMAALAALSLALAIVPRQVTPWTGLLLMFEWAFTIFFLLFGGYLHLIYKWGKATSVQSGSPASRNSESLEYDSGKGHQRLASSCDISPWYYWLGMAFLALAAPILPCFLGFNTLLSRFASMITGVIIFASFMTFASDHLAIRSFLRGLEDRDHTRSKNRCFFL
ncbi:hypothetical protein L484_021997 [Morus notabilis]|uniref:Hexosyltransferase n=1 Tax=Morus notabilis TaxID=981085 RepID=W9SDR0_9ROSA|nr:inositol phosphorylceramide glucuronosyltransferase 1 [Morus notabilis]EXC01426.1 hypothetical protein L484_021997 [Morus notabilis]